MNTYSVIEMQSEILRVARLLSDEFRLPLNRIQFIKTDQFYGRLLPDGTLQIKLEYFDGELVPEMEVWRTLAHELAHLKEPNHDADFWLLNRQLANRIKELGKRLKPEIAFTRKGVVY